MSQADVELQNAGTHQKLPETQEGDAAKTPAYRHSYRGEEPVGCKTKAAAKVIDLVNPKLKSYSKPLCLALLIGFLTYGIVGLLFYQITITCEDTTELIEGKNGIFDLMDKVNTMKAGECMYHAAKFGIQLKGDTFKQQYAGKTCGAIEAAIAREAQGDGGGGGNGPDGGDPNDRDGGDPNDRDGGDPNDRDGGDPNDRDGGDPNDPNQGRRRRLLTERRLEEDVDQDKTIAERNITLCQLQAITNPRFVPCTVPLSYRGHDTSEKLITKTITSHGGKLKWCPDSKTDQPICYDEKGALYLIKRTVCPSYLSALGSAFGYSGIVELLLTVFLITALMQMRVIQKDNAEMKSLFTELFEARGDVKELGGVAGIEYGDE